MSSMRASAGLLMRVVGGQQTAYRDLGRFYRSMAGSGPTLKPYMRQHELCMTSQRVLKCVRRPPRYASVLVLR